LPSYIHVPKDFKVARQSRNPRIIGIDVARALAIFGMILVNFKIVFGDAGNEWIKSAAALLDGKAAATFVFLAGVGLALMTKSVIAEGDLNKLKTARNRILKRALFLFIIGLSYVIIWPADILHFYGVYMAITVLFLTSGNRTIIGGAVGFMLAFPILMTFIDYETSWNFKTYDYSDFWTLKGFTRNLLYNGFHPVIPWTAFMLMGYWFGKQDLNNHKFLKRAFRLSLLIFISIQVLSVLSQNLLEKNSFESSEELILFFGIDPMPPLPLYMINGIAIALAITSACIHLAKKYEGNLIIQALMKTGQLALSFYVAHVVIGMGLIEIIYPNNLGLFTIEFSIAYALIFSLACVLFAVFWRFYKSIGPLEWLMWKMTD
jgi:uncharacterized membrane protein YeiB